MLPGKLAVLGQGLTSPPRCPVQRPDVVETEKNVPWRLWITDTQFLDARAKGRQIFRRESSVPCIKVKDRADRAIFFEVELLAQRSRSESALFGLGKRPGPKTGWGNDAIA